MSVSVGLYGLKPKTKEYEKKLKIYKLCKELKIKVPEEIEEFFDGEPCEEGIKVELPEEAISYPEIRDCHVYDVDISKLSKDITKIRFYICY